MLKKFILLILILLMQNPVKGMHEQAGGEEEKTFQLTHLRKPNLEEEPAGKKAHILFLCTGNSCRSQMAEGWARYLGRDVIEVNSAGIKAHGLNPNAVTVMREIGIDITNQTSKIVTPEMISWSDLIVTVCGDADENCPQLPLKTKKIHWSIVDPAKATGTKEEIINKFRGTRDEIHQYVIKLLTDIRGIL